MFVTREYALKHKLKPIYSLIITGEKSKKKGIIVDCVDAPLGTVIDYENVLGYELELTHPETGEPDLDSKFEQLPPEDCVESKNVKGEKLKCNHHFLSGCSECGKTTKATSIAYCYRYQFPKAPIILISPVNDNEKLLKLKPKIKHLGVDAEMGHYNFVDPETKVQKQWLKNSLVIFDDLESLDEDPMLKDVRSGVRSLLIALLNTGRHQGTSVIVIRHKVCDHKNTEAALREAAWLHFFPGGVDRDIDYALRNYVGFSTQQVKDFLKLGGIGVGKSRCVSVYKQRPISVVSDRVAYIVNRPQD